MPIYSRNSASNMTVVANENYSYQDMGRILVESAQNDMLLFNAVLRSDFQEQAAITEGTMVASELQSFREEAKNGFWTGLKAKLKKLWEKIKGVFRSAYAKLTVWLVRNSKMFGAAARKTLATKPGLDKVKIPMYTKYNEANLTSDVTEKLATSVEELIPAALEGKSDPVNGFDINRILDKAIPGATSENLNDKFKAFVTVKEYKDATVGEIGLKYDTLLANITTQSSRLKAIKKAEKSADNSVKRAIKVIDRAAKAAEGKDEASRVGYSAASKVCSNYETALSRISALQLAAIKNSIAQDRQVIGKMMAAAPVSESADILETVAWLEGADEVNDAIEAPVSDEELKDAVEDAAAEGVEIEINVDTNGEC